MRGYKEYTIFMCVVLIVGLFTGGCFSTTTTTTTTSMTTIITTTTSLTTTTSTSTTTTLEMGWVYTEENKACIAEKEKKWGSPRGYVSGHIVVRFGTDVSELKAKDLIKSYGLNPADSMYVDLDKSYLILVDVPRGLELHWVCELEKNDVINYVTLETTGGGAG